MVGPTRPLGRARGRRFRRRSGVAHDQELGCDRGCDRGGSLVLDLGEADRTNEARNVIVRKADLAQPADEARSFSRAADQAHITKASGEQRCGNNVEIKSVAVGHHGNEGPVGGSIDEPHRIATAVAGHVAGNMGRKGIRPRIDPADREGQRRQRKYEALTDMAGAEEIERRRVVAEPLREAAVRKAPIACRRRSDVIAGHASRGRIAGLGNSDQFARTLGDSERSNLFEVADPKAPSVTVTRPPQHCPSSGPNALLSLRNVAPSPAIICCASASASHSSAPPPMVPLKRPSGRTIMRAPTSRGLEPCESDRVTSTAAPCSVMNRSIVGQTRTIVSQCCASAPAGMQDRFRGRRRVERHRLSGLKACDRVSDGPEDRNAQHQRRLSHGLRAVDRRFTVRAFEQGHTEIGRHVGRAGNLAPGDLGKPKGIVAFTFQESDDGTCALVHLVARDREAFKAIFEDDNPNVKIFEKGKHTRAEIETEFRKHKKNVDLDSFIVNVP